MLQVVVETPEYIKQSRRCMDEISRRSFIDFIAANPTMGDVIKETGGLRKIRWRKNCNEGKRGGVRVIYYYYDHEVPIFLFTAYGKNERATISSAEKIAYKSIVKRLVEAYKEKNYVEG